MQKHQDPAAARREARGGRTVTTNEEDAGVGGAAVSPGPEATGPRYCLFLLQCIVEKSSPRPSNRIIGAHFMNLWKPDDSGNDEFAILSTNTSEKKTFPFLRRPKKPNKESFRNKFPFYGSAPHTERSWTRLQSRPVGGLPRVQRERRSLRNSTWPRGRKTKRRRREVTG